MGDLEFSNQLLRHNFNVELISNNAINAGTKAKYKIRRLKQHKKKSPLSSKIEKRRPSQRPINYDNTNNEFQEHPSRINGKYVSNHKFSDDKSYGDAYSHSNYDKNSEYYKSMMSSNQDPMVHEMHHKHRYHHKNRDKSMTKSYYDVENSYRNSDSQDIKHHTSKSPKTGKRKSKKKKLSTYKDGQVMYPFIAKDI